MMPALAALKSKRKIFVINNTRSFRLSTIGKGSINGKKPLSKAKEVLGMSSYRMRELLQKERVNSVEPEEYLTMQSILMLIIPEAC